MKRLSLRSVAIVWWSRVQVRPQKLGQRQRRRRGPSATSTSRRTSKSGCSRLPLAPLARVSCLVRADSKPERWSLEETFHIAVADQRDVIAELCVIEIKQKMSMAVLLLGHGDEHPRCRYVPVLAILSFSSA